MNTRKRRPRALILFSGGLCPGTNSVIINLALSAQESGMDAFGLFRGFKDLREGDPDKLQIWDFQKDGIPTEKERTGGSILKSSRKGLRRKEGDPEFAKQALNALIALDIDIVFVIGGDDTLLSAILLAAEARNRRVEIPVVHIPKTIDNDLPLPSGIFTYGFVTAAHEVARQLLLLQTEVQDCENRYMIAVPMGRKAGHLTVKGVEIAMQQGLEMPLTFIEEQFDKKCSLAELADLFASGINNRYAKGRTDGLIVAAEGLIDLLAENDQAKMLEHCTKCGYDHPSLGLAPFARTMSGLIQARLIGQEVPIDVRDLDIGYNIRTVPALPEDIEYTRLLSQSAVQAAVNGHSEITVCGKDGKISWMHWADMLGSNGRVKNRLVETADYAEILEESKELLII